MMQELKCPECGQRNFYAELSRDGGMLTLRCADFHEICSDPEGFIEIAPATYVLTARLEVRDDRAG